MLKQSAVDGKVYMAMMGAFTGQHWWRSGVEAEAEIVVGWRCPLEGIVPPDWIWGRIVEDP